MTAVLGNIPPTQLKIGVNVTGLESLSALEGAYKRIAQLEIAYARAIGDRVRAQQLAAQAESQFRAAQLPLAAGGFQISGARDASAIAAAQARAQAAAQRAAQVAIRDANTLAVAQARVAKANGDAAGAQAILNQRLSQNQAGTLGYLKLQAESLKLARAISLDQQGTSQRAISDATNLALAQAKVARSAGDYAGAQQILTTRLGALTQGTVGYLRVQDQLQRTVTAGAAVEARQQAARERAAAKTISDTNTLALAQARVARAGGDFSGAASILQGRLGAVPADSIGGLRLQAALTSTQTAQANAQRRAVADASTQADRLALSQARVARASGDLGLAQQILTRRLGESTAGSLGYLRVQEALIRTNTAIAAQPSFFDRLSGGASNLLKGTTRVIATFFLLQFAVTQVFGALKAVSFSPILAINEQILTATDSLRKFQIIFAGITGSRASGRAAVLDTLAAARGLPITGTEALESISRTGFVPSNARSIQTDAQREQRFNQLLEIVTKLAVINPEQGAAGAQFALRESLAGQQRSLRTRFNISPDVIASLSNTTIGGLNRNPDLVVPALKRFLDAFVSDEALGDYGRLLSIQGGKLKDLFKQFLAEVGERGLYDRVTGFVGGLVTAIESELPNLRAGQGPLAGAAQAISTSLERFADSVILAANRFVGQITGRQVDFGKISSGDIGAIGDVSAGIVDSLSRFSASLALILPDIAAGLFKFGKALGLIGPTDAKEIRSEIAALSRVSITGLSSRDQEILGGFGTARQTSEGSPIESQLFGLGGYTTVDRGELIGRRNTLLRGLQQSVGTVTQDASRRNALAEELGAIDRALAKIDPDKAQRITDLMERLRLVTAASGGPGTGTLGGGGTGSRAGAGETLAGVLGRVSADLGQLRGDFGAKNADLVDEEPIRTTSTRARDLVESLATLQNNINEVLERQRAALADAPAFIGRFPNPFLIKALATRQTATSVFAQETASKGRGLLNLTLANASKTSDTGNIENARTLLGSLFGGGGPLRATDIREGDVAKVVELIDVLGKARTKQVGVLRAGGEATSFLGQLESLTKKLPDGPDRAEALRQIAGAIDEVERASKRATERVRQLKDALDIEAAQAEGDRNGVLRGEQFSSFARRREDLSDAIAQDPSVGDRVRQVEQAQERALERQITLNRLERASADSTFRRSFAQSQLNKALARGEISQAQYEEGQRAVNAATQQATGIELNRLEVLSRQAPLDEELQAKVESARLALTKAQEEGLQLDPSVRSQQRIKEVAQSFGQDISAGFKEGFVDTLTQAFEGGAIKIDEILNQLARRIQSAIANALVEITVIQGLLNPLLNGAFGSQLPVNDLFGGGRSTGGTTQASGQVAGFASSLFGGLFTGGFSGTPAGNAAGVLGTTPGALGIGGGTTLNANTTIGFTKFASGGLVTKPTLALIGENGPEEVRPFHGDRGRGRSAERPTVVQIINLLDSSDVVRAGVGRNPEVIVNPVTRNIRGGGSIHRAIRRRA